MTLPPGTKKSDKAARLSAGTMLLAERASAKEMQRTVELHASEVAAQVAIQDRKRERAAVIALILLAAGKLKAALTEKIRAARLRARDTASRRLALELKAIGAKQAAAKVRTSVTVHIDELHAATSAESLASAWRSRAVHAATKAIRKGENLPKAIAATGPAIKGSVYRTAATETAQAYNEGRVDAAAGLTPHAKYHPDIEAATATPPVVDVDILGSNAEAEPFEDIPEGHQMDLGLDEELAGGGFVLVDMWDATLDGRTCRECASYHGMLTPAGLPFPNGEEPGFPHPYCRCIRTTMAVPASAAEEEVA